MPVGKAVPLASLDLAAPKLGSGKRFAKLSGTLAARGAHDPDALAACIGRQKIRGRQMGALSHGHANPDLACTSLRPTKDEQGYPDVPRMRACRSCRGLRRVRRDPADQAGRTPDPAAVHRHMSAQAPPPPSATAAPRTPSPPTPGCHQPGRRNADCPPPRNRRPRRRPGGRAQDGTAILRHRHGGARSRPEQNRRRASGSPPSTAPTWPRATTSGPR